MHIRHSPIIIHITRTPTPAPIYIASLGNLKPDEEPPAVVVELGLVEVVGIELVIIPVSIVVVIAVGLVVPGISVTRPILVSLL